MEEQYLTFDNKQYKLKVDLYEETGALKVSMIDIQTQEEKEITMKGVELVIPPAPTPDCVIVNGKKDKKIIDKLLELEILSYCENDIFAQFNMSTLYNYDKDGTMKFLDKHAHKVEYEENKGNSLKEVIDNIKREAMSLINSKKTQDILKKKFWPTKYRVSHILINKKNPKDSTIFLMDKEDGEIIFCVCPYKKDYLDKLNPIYDWQFTLEQTVFAYLEEGYELLKNKDMYFHYGVWRELYDSNYETKYEKGVKKYIEHCKKNGITAETINNGVWVKDTPDIMKHYDKNEKQKDKENDR